MGFDFSSWYLACLDASSSEHFRQMIEALITVNARRCRLVAYGSTLSLYTKDPAKANLGRGRVPAWTFAQRLYPIRRVAGCRLPEEAEMALL